MKYSDIRQAGSSDSEEESALTDVPLVSSPSPAFRHHSDTMASTCGAESTPYHSTTSVPGYDPSPLTATTPPTPPVCPAPEHCYTSVCLAPTSDIKQFCTLSDTDSTVSTTPEIMCRICRSEPGSEKIISPCYCAGSLQYVHQSCLLKWLKAYDCVNKHHCELCQYEFKLKPKPWMEWRMPALSVTEQRRATCLVVICVLAVLIVLWSINDLVQNIRVTNIYMNWGFWTKLLFIVFGLFILAFQYPTVKYFYLKLRESNQIVLWGEEGEEQELLETGKLKESSRTCNK